MSTASDTGRIFVYSGPVFCTSECLTLIQSLECIQYTLCLILSAGQGAAVWFARSSALFPSLLSWPRFRLTECQALSNLYSRPVLYI